MIPKRILVATDFGEASRKALDWAIELANALGASIELLHVFDLPIVGLPDASIMVGAATATALNDEAQKGLDAELARVKGRGSMTSCLKQGDPRDAVPEHAKSTHADLLVVGSHGRKGLARALLGSTAESLVRSSPVPVVVVRAH